jgi:hypothetical protein
MGFFDFLRYAAGDAASKKQISKAHGGKHRKPAKGRHGAPFGGPVCGHTWKTPRGRYPHEEHRCGDEPHNRGTHHCYGGEDWRCEATQ